MIYRAHHFGARVATIALILLAAALLGGCRKKGATDDMAGMKMRGASATTPRRDSAAGDGRRGTSDMELAGRADSGVPIDRASASRYGISFARAARRPVRQTVRLVGTLAYAEPRREYLSARVDGWVERLYADYVGKPVHKGEAVLALYAPELVSAQEEYLSARRLGDPTLVAAARRRLALWDVPDDQIDSLERTGIARRTLLLRAPRSGEVVEKMVTQGQAVHSGDNLILIADRSVLWVDMAVYEMDAPAVRIGSRVSVVVDAVPGPAHQGRVTFVYPTVDPKTRTLTARVEVANPDGRLRPGMFATASLTPTAVRGVTVPIQAVLPTGTAELVFVNRGDGTFVPREVETGARGDSLVEVTRGLAPGDEVVASATYLLDSESNLGSAMQGLMLQMGMGLNMSSMPKDGGRSGTAPGADKHGGELKGMKMNGADSARRPR